MGTRRRADYNDEVAWLPLASCMLRVGAALTNCALSMHAWRALLAKGEGG